MNRYKIIGLVNGQPVAGQHLLAKTSRDAALLHQQDYPNVEVTEVWLMQKIPPELWGKGGAAVEPESSRSRVVEIPAMVLGNRPTPELAKSRGAKWAARYAESGGHTAWHPIFTDGLVTHYQFD
jgi:hypothetical protein